jgi:hypothetical protein
VNIAIVRSYRNGKEEGIYVALSIASTPGPMFQQFNIMLIAHGGLGSVYTFVRNGCLTRTSIQTNPFPTKWVGASTLPAKQPVTPVTPNGTRR